ncbi:MAG TPA: circularly permuted type 2 ATP-grasp protein [Gemmataceae bacterium]|nr:circularly permuted type 2 ATP-grasp protein [Gemmataceae bacterium]
MMAVIMNPSLTILAGSANGEPAPDYEIPGCYDEMVDAVGGVRPHWHSFLHALDALGQEELQRRWDEARQLLRENGVAYNVYDDSRGMDRPIALDPIPLLLAPAELACLGESLVQRTRLLEAILADLYGPQTLLSRGLLPPELVFDAPGFLRCCHGVRPAGNRYLHLYGANLGRSPDGQVWVLGDRTQAPSGAGYALENRIVLARMLPKVFRACQVQRLAQFFLTLRETLRNIAPAHHDNPRVVLLTPGPFNETFFEHAFLARYLGYTLVQGGDLTVRGDRVFLKLLGGLQPVDVILRRLDDDYCDPLELRADSFLGVPGLVQAVRAGNVAVANPLGSGLVETPALLAYLPALCRHLLGEELRLPSVPSWWCGDPTACNHVLANLPRMVIKPTSPSARVEPIFGGNLSREKLAELAERIRARPRDFVGQEQLTLATTPVLTGETLQARHFVLRTFLAATADTFTVMPGGLTRYAATPDSLVVSMQRGGGTKDTWALASGPVSSVTLLPPPDRPVELSRGGSDLSSRTADNLYWLGRYVERAEGATRLLRTILVRLTEESALIEVPELPALLRALTHQGLTYPGFVGEGAEARLAAPEDELRSLIFDITRCGSLQWTIHTVQHIARLVRDQISADTWRVLNSLKVDEHGSREPAEMSRRITTGTLSDVLETLEGLLISLTAFGGLAMESMVRGRRWQFLDMGRRIERANHTIILIRSTLATVEDNEVPVLEAVLEVAESSITYRRRYLSSLQAAPVLDLLLLDESNPRSLAFQLVALADSVERLPQDDSTPRRPPEQRIMLAILTHLRLADIELLARPNRDGVRQHLVDWLVWLTEQLPLLSDTIAQNYLTHVAASRHLAALKPEASS